MFCVDMSSSMCIGKKKKSILILRKGPTQELDDTKLTSEKKYSVTFAEQQKKFSLSFHYNKMNT